MDKLRELQLVELDLFKQFAKICEKYGITYYALGGTLLGAVRHQGFIPWDDDMDIGVPREDYERLEEILAKELTGNATYHTFHNDESYHRFFGHIENPGIKVRRNDKMVEEVSSAWIDIFPLDGMPNGKWMRKIWEKYILFLRALYRFSCFSIAVDVNKKNRPWHEKALVWLGLHFPVEKMFSTRKRLLALEKALKKYPYEKSDWLVNAMGAYKFREMFHKKIYGSGRAYPFEDTQIWGPEDYDAVCTQLYGDYMTPADKNHHNLEIIE